MKLGITPQENKAAPSSQGQDPSPRALQGAIRRQGATSLSPVSSQVPSTPWFFGGSCSSLNSSAPVVSRFTQKKPTLQIQPGKPWGLRLPPSSLITSHHGASPPALPPISGPQGPPSSLPNIPILVPSFCPRGLGTCCSLSLEHGSPSPKHELPAQLKLGQRLQNSTLTPIRMFLGLDSGSLETPQRGQSIL